MVLFLAIFSSGCSKVRREYCLYQATRAQDKGDYKTAIAKYKEVLGMNPKDDAVNYNLGVAYIYHNEMDKAREQAKKLERFGFKDYGDLLQELIDKATERESQE